MSELKQQRGVTLLEILIAMVILSVGLLGIAGLTIGVIQGNAYSKHVSTATVVAEAKLEDIRRAGYANANAMAGSDSVSMGGITFSRTTSVTNGSPGPNMKRLAVTVSWEAYSVTLDTILAQ